MGRAGARRRGVRRRFRPVGTRRRACRGAAAGRRCRGASHASGVAHRRPDERRRRLGLRSPVLRLGLEPVGQVPCGGDLLPAELAVDESARTGEVGSFEPGALEHRAVQVGAGQVRPAQLRGAPPFAARTWPASGTSQTGLAIVSSPASCSTPGHKRCRSERESGRFRWMRCGNSRRDHFPVESTTCSRQDRRARRSECGDDRSGRRSNAGRLTNARGDDRPVTITQP